MAADARAYRSLSPAGMGRGLGRWAEASVRGDEIAWLRVPEAGIGPSTLAGDGGENGEVLGAGLDRALQAMGALRDDLLVRWGCGCAGATAGARSGAEVSGDALGGVDPGCGLGGGRCRDGPRNAGKMGRGGGAAGAGAQRPHEPPACPVLAQSPLSVN